MSQHVHPTLIIEWAPGSVTAYQPVLRTTRQGASIAAVASEFEGSETLVAISRRAGFVRTIRVPNVGKTELELVMRNAVAGLFPVVGNELAYDFTLTEDVTQEGRLALVAAVHTDHLRSIFEEAKQIGLKVRAIVPASLAAPTIAGKAGVKDGAVLEQSNGTLSIDLVQDGVLRYSRVSAFSSDIEAEVSRTYAAAGLPCRPSIAAGDTGVQADLRTTMSTLDALAEIDLVHPPLNIESAEEKAKHETARRQRDQRITGIAFAGAVAVAAILAWGRYGQNQEALAKSASATKNLKTLQSHHDAQVKLQSDAEPAFDLVHRGFEPAQPFADVITTFTNAVPQGVWLNGVTLERGKAFTIRGVALKAELVTDYVRKLNTDKRLRNVVLLFASNSTIESKSVVEFSITGFPVGNLPLTDPPKSGSKPTTGTGGTA